ncbi:uncharacterized protein LOC9662526 isoform X4 [Selaginella moellendorffii]|uniref:uncharacterized protein LOC9662526 isoform X4 n=1 Tax=Selaginella moellendorffii TaxID=88036 RepID=UPI000D1C7C0D|nr:uncharacterized protein LOC9662526 isoform X4 [Selaginella moellendorffii]|eukprot:XP_024542357.1 uncharacterized protein LOC9662526 isoform X4 [Selaginella moellendorffii]
MCFHGLARMKRTRGSKWEMDARFGKKSKVCDGSSESKLHCGKTSDELEKEASDESKTKRREDACHRNAHDSKSECKVYCGNELEKEAGELQMRREMEACHWKKSKAGDDRSESGKTSYELEKEGNGCLL